MSDDGTGRLVIVPTTLRQARAFVATITGTTVRRKEESSPSQPRARG